MANALPILLLGGAAALMLAGKKKKKSGAIGGGQIILPPTTPPPLPASVKKSGSGYPGVSRAKMQEIQTMLVANGYDVGSYGLDGKYGPATKQAVWEFQEDWGGLTVDGKPGSNTQTALRQAEAARLEGQRTAVQKQPQKKTQVADQCDPLDPGTWGSGNVCVFDGTKWARQRAQVKPAPKAPSKPASDSDSGGNCYPDRSGTWDIKNGGVCIAKNTRIYLTKWLPDNVLVGFNMIGHGWWWRGGHGDHDGVDKFWEGRDKFPRVEIDILGHTRFARLIGAVKSMAINYPETLFYVTLTNTAFTTASVAWAEKTFFSTTPYSRAYYVWKGKSEISANEFIDLMGKAITEGPSEI